MSLYTELQSINTQIDEAQQVVQQLKAKRDEMLQARLTCKHDFVAPMKGYEHEGGACVHCGMNEIQWDHINAQRSRT